MNQQQEQDLLRNLNRPLLAWYRRAARDLPWRRDRDPYHIWVSEIMLQQTRVEAVKPYYARFLMELPDIRHLAEVPEERLLKLWEGLGYYNRVRNMQKAARLICEQYGGFFPSEYDAIRKLPGIGDYTAGAVGSIAFGIPEPAVDGNVLRVVSRLLARREDILSASVKKSITALLRETMPQKEPGLYNQALMELGATVCVPNGEPLCAACPLAKDCLAAKEGLTGELPVRIKKQKRRIEEKTILLIRDGSRTGIRKRPETGLLAGLYEFPSLEGFCSEKEVVRAVSEMGFVPLRISRLIDAKHVFSHVEWHMHGFVIWIAEQIEEDGKLLFVENDRLARDYAVPSAFKAYLDVLHSGIFYR